MFAISRVAAATFFESWRRRFLNAILVFAVIIIGSSWSLMYLQPGAELKMLLDVGLGSLRFFGILLAVFLGVRLIADELEKRTIHTTLTKPITRAQFLLGKFFGALLTVWSNMLLMAIVFIVVFAIKAPELMAAQGTGAGAVMGEPSVVYANVGWSILLHFCEAMVVTALAVMASTLFSWVMGAIFSFFIYFVGQFADFFKSLAHTGTKEVSNLSRYLFDLIYKVLPHFEAFDLRESVLQATPIREDTILLHVGMAVGYTVILMFIGFLAFWHREV
jgi:ABC-type transport system involved in multi-copper enzyme maturation permease subunit